MKLIINIPICILFFLVATFSMAQEEQSWVSDHIDFSGYVKYLNISGFNSLDSISNDNLLHNRINLKYYANENLTGTFELRNRIFWGTSVKSVPDYASIIENTNQSIDLNMLLIDQPALILISNIDRLNIDYHTDNWQITLGRQRINWGKNLVWNPNDLFNAYNYFDFDYEERPGTDALRINYFTSGDSSFEFAVDYTKKWEDNTMAIKYNFNKFQYDFQMIAAKFMENYTFGIGWEGAIKSIGFKGEFSYFLPYNNSQETNAFVGSVSLDYFFKNGFSLDISSIYNSEGESNLDSIGRFEFAGNSFNAKSLMPNKWSGFAQISNSFTPAMSASFSTIYAIDLKMVFLMPQYSYSISQNWDFDITGQFFYGELNDDLSNLGNNIYLRFRYSF